jgi:hypothetical protein
VKKKNEDIIIGRDSVMELMGMRKIEILSI